ncbi:sigma-70 family RNA polymerase sigma factor [Zestomonas carbonaria]|uniref:Putative RNA polymerase sigma factor FecI n=1 Tax=Zestomonas carbonaria TaxID=2762745 RepID=A0A7U7ELN2_9GAMM|nr:sigma-70 family RNA polymerase sigma factor [Pseudomonas carbonaria]CAD5107294.1 putative RNA polymerase sigma factor FecI [Pseudomonas carbonaria]
MSAVDSSLHDAVRHLYNDHHGWLYGWLRKRLGCADNAADLAQDTFARILASRRVLEAREPRAYLTTVAKGLMINWYQRQSLERAYLDALACLPEELAPPPEQRLIVLETLHEIDALLASLPDGVRSAFLLSQIEGLKYEDIARELGVSLGSVKRYMQQAFRQCLELMT